MQSGTVLLTYGAADKYGNDTPNATFAVEVTRVFSTAIAAQTFTAGEEVAAFTLPPPGGSGVLRYTLSGAAGALLPAGLTFAANTRVVGGTPTQAGAATLTYIAYDDAGEVTRTAFGVTILYSLADISDQTYVAGAAVDLTLPALIGANGAPNYALLLAGEAATAANLPAGLSFDGDSRVLSGTPPTAAVVMLTYTASDGGVVVAMEEFALAITGPAFAAGVLPLADKSYAAAVTITPLTLPALSGAAPLTYVLVGPGEQDLAAAAPGFAFSADRVLSGAVYRGGDTQMTYRITDRYANVTEATFGLSITGAPVITNPPNQRTYNSSTTAVQQILLLSAATGGSGALTYMVTGRHGETVFDAIPSGTFTATAARRELRFVRIRIGDTLLLYTVTDAIGAYTEVPFTITILDSTMSLDLAQHADVTAAIGQSTTVTLPDGIGATPAVSYTYELGGLNRSTLAVALPAAEAGVRWRCEHPRTLLHPHPRRRLYRGVPRRDQCNPLHRDDLQHYRAGPHPGRAADRA